MSIPVLRGPLRSTTPDMKKQFKYKKQFDISIKQPSIEIPKGMTYMSPVNLIETTKQKKHLFKSPENEFKNRSATPVKKPLIKQHSNLSQNLVPKFEQLYIAQKNIIPKHYFQQCSFENINLQKCFECSHHKHNNNKNENNNNNNNIKTISSNSKSPRQFNEEFHNVLKNKSTASPNNYQRINNCEKENIDIRSNITRARQYKKSDRLEFSPISNDNSYMNRISNENPFKLNLNHSNYGNIISQNSQVTIQSSRGGTYFKK